MLSSNSCNCSCVATNKSIIIFNVSGKVVIVVFATEPVVVIPVFKTVPAVVIPVLSTPAKESVIFEIAFPTFQFLVLFRLILMDTSSKVVPTILLAKSKIFVSNSSNSSDKLN